MSEALIRLLKYWDEGVIKSLPDELILNQIPLVLFQALFRTLQKQNANGSWGTKPSREITAYAIIALSNLASLPFLAEIFAQIQAAIEKGRSYIQFGEEAPSVEYIWMGKVSYSPIHVSKAYILAALKTKYPKYILGSSLTEIVGISRSGLRQYMRFYSSLPRLNGIPLWKIQGCIMEGYLYLRQLERIRLDIFERANMKKDEYIDFIAIGFACANNLQPCTLKTNIVFDLMTLALRTYQIDEYVEFVISRKLGHSIPRVMQVVEKVFQDVVSADKGLSGHSQGHGNATERPSIEKGSGTRLNEMPREEDFAEIYDKLSAFALSITCHPSVHSASQFDRNLITYALHECLIAEITQINDSHQYLTEAEPGLKTPPRGSFHNWVRTTAISHNCAPLFLIFLHCLVGGGSHGSRSAEEQYLIQDLWTHLSIKCRIENDRASFLRDRKEKNLNSLDFPEFAHSESTSTVPSSQEQLSAILTYERRCCELAFAALQKATGEGAKSTDLEALKFYYFLSDVFDDIYSARDISCERE